MRATVLVFDLLVYVPSVLFFLNRRLAGRGLRTRTIAAISILLQPALILVENGHFQYNSVMLGLCALTFALLYSSLPNPEAPAFPAAPASVAAGKGEQVPAKADTEVQGPKISSLTRIISYQYILAAVAFSLALGFKQMTLFFAPAVFAVMLGRCWGLTQVGFDKG